jgi:hypothetical protein
MNSTFVGFANGAGINASLFSNNCPLESSSMDYFLAFSLFAYFRPSKSSIDRSNRKYLEISPQFCDPLMKSLHNPIHSTLDYEGVAQFRSGSILAKK